MVSKIEDNKNRTLMIGLTPPLEGGSQMHIAELAKRIDCDVLTQKGSICNNKIEMPDSKLKSEFMRNMAFAIVVYFYSFKLMFWKKKYKTIHINENLLYFLAPLLCWRYKIVTTVHGLKGFKFYDNKLLWFFFKNALRHSNKIIAVSLEDKKLLDKECKYANITYIANGVDLSLYKNINPLVEKKIMFIGRVHEQKGIDVLLEAFCNNTKDIQLDLEIIGDANNDYAKMLEKKYPLFNRKIIWRGNIQDRAEIVRSLK